MLTLLQTPFWVSLPLGLSAMFFIWGALAARARGRSGVMWGIASAVTWFIGIAILYSLGHRLQTAAPGQRSVALERTPEGRLEAAVYADAGNDLRPAADIATGESAEDRRWRYLCEYHPEVRKAVVAVAPLGEDALYELKAAHLAVGDAGVLPAIVQRLGERFAGYAAAPATPARNGAVNGHATDAAANRQQSNDDDEPLMLEAPVIAARRPPSGGGARVEAAAKAPPVTAKTVESAAPTEAGPGKSPPAAVDDDYEADALTVAAASQAGSVPVLVDGDDDGEPEYDARDARPADGRSAAPPAAAKTPSRTDVTPADLVGARFLETYASVHLFGLADGRVFIDRHEARGSLDLARNYVDQVAARRALG